MQESPGRPEMDAGALALCHVACTLCCMTGKQIAEQDQAQAREREFDRAAQRWAVRALILFGFLGAYALLAAMGWVPAMPWSPIGLQQ
jgi:hypothetical protein